MNPLVPPPTFATTIAATVVVGDAPNADADASPVSCAFVFAEPGGEERVAPAPLAPTDDCGDPAALAESAPAEATDVDPPPPTCDCPPLSPGALPPSPPLDGDELESPGPPPPFPLPPLLGVPPPTDTSPELPPEEDGIDASAVLVGVDADAVTEGGGIGVRLTGRGSALVVVGGTSVVVGGASVTEVGVGHGRPSINGERMGPRMGIEAIGTGRGIGRLMRAGSRTCKSRVCAWAKCRRRVSRVRACMVP